MSVICKECKEDFSSLGSLHKHIKAHGIHCPEYYVKHYARKNLLTGELLPYKDYESYFSNDFTNAQQLTKWCKENPIEVVRPYIIEKLKRRKEDKSLKYAPFYLDLKLSRLPSIELYQNICGGYCKAAKELGMDIWYKDRLPKDFDFIPNDLKIFIDTREQKPLHFDNSESVKLDFGDYTLAGEHYNYTFVDRKSSGDFKGTMTGGYERFKEEMNRAREFHSFIFVVVESSISDIYAENNFKQFHKANIEFIWHQLKELQREYMDCCQFVFSGSRERSEELIPKILFHGKKLWKVDLQYYLEAKQ